MSETEDSFRLGSLSLLVLLAKTDILAEMTRDLRPVDVRSMLEADFSFPMLPRLLNEADDVMAGLLLMPSALERLHFVRVGVLLVTPCRSQIDGLGRGGDGG